MNNTQIQSILRGIYLDTHFAGRKAESLESLALRACQRRDWSSGLQTIGLDLSVTYRKCLRLSRVRGRLAGLGGRWKDE